MTDPRADGWSPLDDGDSFTALVGPLWVRGEGTAREFGILVERKHLSRFDRLHGGMLLWLADKSMGQTAWHAGGQPKQHATIQLDTQFMQVVQEGQFVQARCDVVRTTRSLIFMRVRMACDGVDVASASGIWKYR